MSVEMDYKKANNLATILYNSFSTNGILGQTEMP